MKAFKECLEDNFIPIEITDPDLLRKYRSDGVKIDMEPIYRFIFGDHQEYSLDVEPIGEEGQYQIVLYKHGINIIDPLIIHT